MNKTGTATTIALLSVLAIVRPAVVSPASKSAGSKDGNPVCAGISNLWNNPADISSRDLFYGAGGKEDEPHGPYVFVTEDLEGSNPKFVVRDRDKVEWKVKLGIEAPPETVASRLVWAVGYFTDEDYFLPELKVERMPAHLHRGQKMVGPDGTVHNVRLKRHPKEMKKIGSWKWRDNPFSGTREMNGLRVMMALINNWDLKDENNAICDGKAPGGSEIYMVSDLGASFGTAGITWPLSKSRGNLKSYVHSKLTSRIEPGYVNFEVPARPALLYLIAPHQFFSRLRLRWLGRQIPNSDVAWIGHFLAQLSADQIRDAFRAGGYSGQELEGFTKVVQKRISELINDVGMPGSVAAIESP